MFAFRRFSALSLLPILSACLVGSADAQTAYPQPDPSADEQFMLERINVARANPTLEGLMLADQNNDSLIHTYYNYYGVSLAGLVNSFNSYPVQPPLAMNPKLMASARVESLDMATRGFQSHTGTNGSTFTSRIDDQGYSWGGAGENIYAYSEDAFFGHVGFNADWGVPSLDHRANIMNNHSDYPLYREIGISCVPTSKPGFGPMVITQDFAKPANAGVAYVLGVVYADANGDSTYTQGEGLANVTVRPDAGGYYAVTASAGGFVVPLPASGSGVLTITASGGALGEPRTKAVAWTAGTNVKVDFTVADAVAVVPPAAQPPVVPVAPAPAAPPVVSLGVPAKNANVNNGRLGVVTLSRDGDASLPLWIAVTYSGTAVNGVDYARLPAKVLIPAGEYSTDLVVESYNAEPVLKSLYVNVRCRARYQTATETVLHGRVNIVAAQ